MRNLSFGDEGPEVSKLQRHLKALSFYTGEVDGVFGEGTQEAVVEFQKVFLVTGWADRVTEELIVRKHAENLIPEPEPEPEPDERPGGFHSRDIIWRDEFSDNGFPDPSLWSPQTTILGGDYGESQRYVGDQDHLFVEGGELVIRAKRSSYGFSSGQLTSLARWAPPKDGSRSYRIEAMMKMASGPGTWSAFRLFGNENWRPGRWPRSGEIEVAGYSGESQTFQVAAHTGYRQPTISGSASPDNPEDEYHLYSVNFYNDRIEWFIGYDKILTLPRPIRYEPYINWPFQDDEGNSFNIVLNLALGGRGGTTNYKYLPAEMRVKYVRVYEK